MTGAGAVTPAGRVEAGFERVRNVFTANFAERGDVGAAVAVYVAGRPVVDLWGGEARPGRPWVEDTMVGVFSTTKGPTALTVQVLADRGLLDVDRPVAAYWPEFGAAGKEHITVRQVLSHQAGIITFPDYHEVLELDDHWGVAEEIAARIAAAAPLWEPGTRHGYHALTFGWILGEVVRRVTGATLGTVFRTEVAEPLDVDFWIGLPAAEHDRAADLIDSPPITDPTVAVYVSMFNEDTWTGQAHFVGPDGIRQVADAFNSPEYRSAEIPAGGGIGTARGLARMYGALAAGGTLDGVDLVSPASIKAFAEEQVHGLDAVLVFETRYGLGYARPTETLPMGPNDAAFGHGGLGGSLAFADPEAGVGFAYTPNQLQFPRLDTTTRSQALIEAVYASL